MVSVAHGQGRIQGIAGAYPGISKGGGRNLKPSVFRPKASEEQKKKVNTSADVQFSGPKSSEEQKEEKKRVITPSDCPLYVYHLYTTKVLCICLRGVAAPAPPPLDTPLGQDEGNEPPISHFQRCF